MVSWRTLSLIFLLGTVAMSHNAFSRQAGDMVENIVKAIEQSSARDMAKYFSTNVDLSLPRAEGTFSKSQSEMILRDFFSRNTPSSFQVSHEGISRDGSVYFIGRLSTKEGQSYRCYFLIKQVSRSFFLHHIQIELQ